MRQLDAGEDGGELLFLQMLKDCCKHLRSKAMTLVILTPFVHEDDGTSIYLGEQAGQDDGWIALNTIESAGIPAGQWKTKSG